MLKQLYYSRDLESILLGKIRVTKTQALGYQDSYLITEVDMGGSCIQHG